MTIPATQKRKILAVGPAQVALKEYEQLASDYEIHLINRGPRDHVKGEIKRLCETEGPFEAAFILFANGGYAPMDQDLLGPMWENGNNVGVFAQCGTGYDNVNVKDITAHKCYFTNTPDAVTESTADFTVFLFLAALRGSTMCEMACNNGQSNLAQWRAGTELTTDPRGLTVGIIGLGRIGKDFARKIRAFGVNIIYNTRTKLSDAEEKELEVSYATRDELVKTSDVISILTPSTPETYRLLDTEQFEMMKPGVFIINSSRGTTINEAALVEGLKSGKVSRAALDVFEEEPRINPYLLNNPRVTITPHVAAYTTGTIFRGERDAFNNVRAFLEKGAPVTPVNGPF